MRLSYAWYLVPFLVSCSAKPEQAPVRTAAEERQHDSILGASRIPGATGVSKALGAADSGAARVAREDSIANSQ